MTAFSRSAHTLRVASLATAAGLSVVVLAGCSSAASTPTPAPTVTVTVSPSATPAASPASPTAKPDASTGATPVNIDCSNLVFDQVVTGFDADFKAVKPFTPEPGSSFGTIAELSGTTCGWKDASAGSLLTVGVAKPKKSDLENYQAVFVATGTSTDALPGSPANRSFVAPNTAFPEMDMFTESGYWISVTSSAFASPGDASTVFANILQALPSG